MSRMRVRMVWAGVLLLIAACVALAAGNLHAVLTATAGESAGSVVTIMWTAFSTVIMVWAGVMCAREGMRRRRAAELESENYRPPYAVTCAHQDYYGS